jgi:hypothetical protein
MSTFGYNPHSWELITLFHSGPPDFARAEELLRLGADVNDQGNDKDENVLSGIIEGYRDSRIDEDRERCGACKKEYEDCIGCPFDKNPELGPSLLKVIRFFLDHGFDVNKDNGRYGAQCLAALVLSTFDRYMIDATKLLLHAGAQNIDAYCDEDSTPMGWMGDEASYQNTCWHDYSLGNIYEAVYQVYVAAEAGRPYDGVDSYESSIGKRILRVLAEVEPGTETFFSVDDPTSRHDNCFTCNLYFMYDGGFLKTTRYASFWVDTELPDSAFTDVSDRFLPLIGAEIESFSFGHHSIVKGTTHYGQPITTIRMDNGSSVAFTINFGEVEKEDYCAYYHLDVGKE